MQRAEDRRQQRIAAGELAWWAACEQYAPVSQGVILRHALRSGETCAGDGTIAPRPEHDSLCRLDRAADLQRSEANVHLWLSQRY
jgi:hypothetical protein